MQPKCLPAMPYLVVVIVALSAGTCRGAFLGIRSQSDTAMAPLQAFVQEEGTSFKVALTTMEHDLYGVIARKVGYPLPVVQHDKDPASGYNPGSPLYDEQERWVERNGDNSIPGPGGQFGWVPEPWRTVWQQFYDYPVYSVLGLFFQIFLVLVFAYLYLQYMPTWRKNHADLAYHSSSEADSWTDWRHHPFDANCTSDWQLCIWGLCCPFIRWADNVTHDRVAAGSFWGALLFMLFMNIISPLTFGISLVVALCVAIYFRQRMRRTFNLSPGEPKTVFLDTLLWCCCPFCALMQETRQVEKQSAVRAFNQQ